MKKLLIIILTIIGLFGFTYVKAEEIKKNEFVINDWVDLYYSRTNNNNVKKGRFVIIRNKEDNNFAYCIEPLKTAKENYLYTGYELKNINNINKDILKEILNQRVEDNEKEEINEGLLDSYFREKWKNKK